MPDRNLALQEQTGTWEMNEASRGGAVVQACGIREFLGSKDWVVAPGAGFPGIRPLQSWLCVFRLQLWLWLVAS